MGGPPKEEEAGRPPWGPRSRKGPQPESTLGVEPRGQGGMRVALNDTSVSVVPGLLGQGVEVPWKVFRFPSLRGRIGWGLGVLPLPRSEGSDTPYHDCWGLKKLFAMTPYVRDGFGPACYSACPSLC